MTDTMTREKALLEERASIWARMQEITNRAVADGRDLTDEENQSYAAAEEDLDKKGAEVDRLRAHRERERQMGQVDRSDLRGVPTASDEQREEAGPVGTKLYERAFDKWVRGGRYGLEGEEVRALQAGFQATSQEELRAAGVGTASAGGYTVPPAFRNRLVEKLVAVTAVRQVAEVISTDSGADLPWPTVDDTGNIGAILAENTQVTEQDVTFGQASLKAYMYTSKLIRVSFQLLNDTGFDLEGFLARILATRIGRIQNQHFTTGTGTAQPQGLVTGGTVGATLATGNTTGLTVTTGVDGLLDLIDSVDIAYASGDLRWMFSQTYRRLVRKLRDADNRLLWEPSLQVGTPDSLLGYGIVLNNDMPPAAANSKSVAFGDFREGYVIRDVNDFFLLRLEERYADFLQTGFVGFQRSDGAVQNAFAYKLLQQSAT